MAGVQSRTETGQADAPGIRQGLAEADLAQAQGGEPEGARASVLRATAVLRCRRRVPLRRRPVPVPVGAYAAATALRKEGGRRRQPDGGHHRPGREPRQSALYGAVDGQKFGVERPTVKARYSRKYFGRGKGVVADRK